MKKFLTLILVALSIPSFNILAKDVSEDQNNDTGNEQAENTTNAAETFIQEMGDHAIEILRASKNLESRRSQFRGLFEKYFSIPTIAKNVLGGYWKKATPEQQKEFIKLFEEKTFNIYTAKLQNYANQNFFVTKSRQAGNNTYFVYSLVKSGSEADAELIWKVGYDGKLYRIVDVKVEGISQVTSQRNEYARILATKNVEGLLIELRAKQD